MLMTACGRIEPPADTLVVAQVSEPPSLNPQAAQCAAESSMQGIGQLHGFPLLGTEAGSAPDPSRIRDLVIGKYIARDLVGGSEIHILRIWHHKESRPRL
ncbi:hypothetical protein F2Q65_02405 [Thiohalocapsa marina]|uniref:Type II toxin-antitoxin system RelE/ParE family toxin n=1 Tax=Thiohalocapsa marina TaxID=424902 RepID=A0A5M8FUD4_9GAMM|nr:type II toxin-antitoxin system RelE/ParE family toxin [Thiohalocapsa marina]KAA6187393.1 hypothetical protein F2Q65_02405 [Thiohalocapsa marina]